MQWWKRIGNEMLDVLFPPSELESAVRRASYDDLASRVSVMSVSAVENAVALFPYRDSLVRQAVWELKYRGSRHVARLFAQALADYLLDELADEAPFAAGPPTIVPVPLSPARRRERGWNQVELIAEELIRLLPSDTLRYNPNLLVRTKNTESQTKTHSKQEREENLVGAFSLYMEAIPPVGPVILLDDVITTGATLRAACEALRERGVREVRCVGVAH